MFIKPMFFSRARSRSVAFQKPGRYIKLVRMVSNLIGPNSQGPRFAAHAPLVVADLHLNNTLGI